jgi:MtN3 and saliva related transmembrane protein
MTEVAGLRLPVVAAAAGVGLGAAGFAFGVQAQQIGAPVAPGSSLTEVIGFLAGFGTTFAAFPDLVAMLRRRSRRGMNPRMAGIMGAFQLLWIWYGLLIGSLPVIMWNTIAVVINLLVVVIYVHYARAEQRGIGQTANG